MYHSNWEDHVSPVPFEEYDRTKYAYPPLAMVLDWMYTYDTPQEWVASMTSGGYIPYYDEFGTIRWKIKRSKDGLDQN